MILHNGLATMNRSTTRSALVQLLSQAERAVLRELTALFEARGSTVDQWRVLTLLADGRGHPMGELADFTFLPPPTLTRLVDRMVTDALVYRRIDPEDRRRVLIFSSARGRRLHAKLRDDVERYEAELVEPDGLDVAALTTLLDRLAQRSGE